MKIHHVAIFLIGASLVQARAQLVDFETLPDGSFPTEGMAISNQYAAAFGLSFALEDGGFPRIAKADGTKFTAFVNNTGSLSNHLASAPNQACGNYFLAGDNGWVASVPTNSMNLIISYATPVANASGAVLDIDGTEEWLVRAYNGTNLIDHIALSANTPNAGDGLATLWSFTHASADITSIHIEYDGTTGGSIGFAFDNFSPAWTALPEALSLQRTNNASLLEVTGKCDNDPYYQIEWTSSLDATSWQFLTNVFLTNASLAFVLDQTQTSVSDRFYRATEIFSPSVPPPSGLVAWWPADGTTTNIAGTNIGTRSLSGTSFAPGKVGQAFSFDGTNGYIMTSLDVQTAAMPNSTWEAWVYPTRINYANPQPILSDQQGTNSNPGLNIGTDSTFGIHAAGAGGWKPVVASLNEWQHVAVVYSPTNVLFYKNGVEYSYGAAPSLQSTTNSLFIGKNPASSNFFQGLIDEVSIYNRALSAAEIRAIYSAGGAGKFK